jgi:hypothetical protein
MWGLDPSAPKHTGWVKGGLLAKYTSDKSELEEMRRVWSIGIPWKQPKDKDFARKRKLAKSYKNKVYYNLYDEYNNPKVIDSTGITSVKPDFFLAGYQLPRWSDLQSILFNHISCGRTTQGRNLKVSAKNMLDHLLSNDPIGSWLKGGYEVDSPFYRTPGLTPEFQLLYNSLRNSKMNQDVSVIKTEVKDSYSFMKQGSGSEFLKSLGIQFETTVEEESQIFNIDMEDVPDVESYHSDDETFEFDEEDENILFSEDDSDVDLISNE